MLLICVISENKWVLCFGLLFGQKKQFEDVTLGSGKLWRAFVVLLWHFIEKNELSIKTIGRLTDNENNH